MTQGRKWNKNKVIKEILRLHRELKRRPVKRDYPMLNVMARKYFGSWNNAMKASGYKTKELQHITIPSLSPNFWYFIGLLITDGHIQYQKSKKYRIVVSTSYNKEKEMISRLTLKLFDYKPLIVKRKYGWNILPNYEIIISSKDLLKFLNKKINIPLGAKSKTIRVPKLLFSESSKNIFSFIRGVIDGDGDISIKKNMVRISSGSYLFLRDMKKLLLNVNISSGKILKERTVFRINISTLCNIRRLYEHCYISDFYYPRKKKQLDKLLKE